MPHAATAEAEGAALFAELRPWSPIADPEDWIRLGPRPVVEHHDATATWPTFGGCCQLDWDTAPAEWFPPLSAPDPAIETLWRDGHFGPALRSARRWRGAHPGEPAGWVWWIEAWMARPAHPERGVEWLRRIADAPDDPSYRVAAAGLLISHVEHQHEDLWTRLDEARDPLRHEVAGWVEFVRIWRPQECLAIASWHMARGDGEGAERWGQRAIDSAPSPDRSESASVVGPDPGPATGKGACCTVGVPTPVIVAVVGTRENPSVVPFVPRVHMDACSELARWLDGHRAALQTCLTRPDPVEAVVRIDPDGHVTGDGLDAPVRGCLAELQRGGPGLTWDLVVRDLRFRAGER